ncbi:hypothetical protein STEG23_015319 [Scotinomys teguina]
MGLMVNCIGPHKPPFHPSEVTWTPSKIAMVGALHQSEHSLRNSSLLAHALTCLSFLSCPVGPVSFPGPSRAGCDIRSQLKIGCLPPHPDIWLCSVRQSSSELKGLGRDPAAGCPVDKVQGDGYCGTVEKVEEVYQHQIKLFHTEQELPPNGYDTDPADKNGGGEGHAYGTRSGYLLVVQTSEKSYMEGPKIRPQTQTAGGHQQMELAANEQIM